MGILKEKLMDSQNRPKVVADCVSLVDSEVASKSGVTGMMIKGGYKAFKAVKPTMVQEAIEHLYEDFLDVLDRHYEEYRTSGASGTPFDKWATSRDTRIANDLLRITDDIMNRSSKAVIRKIYMGLRTVAERNVAQAVPGIGRMVARRVSE